MLIRHKLTFQFLTIVATIMLLSSVLVYYFSSTYRQTEFENRLTDKANTTARLLIEVDEVDSTLLKIIDKNNLGSLHQELVVIYNYLDKEIYSTDENNVFHPSREIFENIRLNKKTSFKLGEYEMLGLLYTDKYNRFIVVAGAIDKYGLSKLENLRTILFLVFFLSIAVATLSGWIYSGKAMAPISHVIEQVDTITETNLSSRVDQGNGRDEIARLAGTFNRMLDRLEAAFKLQRTFVANASHELRTPLTSITGQLEVALMTERDVPKYREIIRSVLDDIKNLNYLSNRLLSLAHASMDELDLDFTYLRIDELLWDCREELLRRNPDYKADVIFEDMPNDESTLVMKGNDQLLKIAFINLMDNGCKFSADHKVRVKISFNSGQLLLQFIDNGIGIPEDEHNFIFEPFFRASNAISKKGHGIGLSIVKRIVRLHKGDITLSSFSNSGTSFTINLPLKF